MKIARKESEPAKECWHSLKNQEELTWEKTAVTALAKIFKLLKMLDPSAKPNNPATPMRAKGLVSKHQPVNSQTISSSQALGSLLEIGNLLMVSGDPLMQWLIGKWKTLGTTKCTVAKTVTTTWVLAIPRTNFSTSVGDRPSRDTWVTRATTGCHSFQQEPKLLLFMLIRSSIVAK